MKGYGRIVAPLTILLKKKSFNWNEEATQTFAALIVVMMTPPVLG